ncbi:MAG: D-glycero-beta-D-manno-heptose 1-phosphate adenylyltransferase [Nitrospira sp.]|nr:D-glycero-beta-D-manno-heptose 1-phosphate adenylyltransferase [Candidatus Brocadiales bacterium]MBL7048358.1 D-glycero-beta-D-manno-heptose 1-phosphate adenylyltransferase [Nitrospira sp.]
MSYSKITPIKKISAIIEARRRDGGKVVFTNGCFDLIHAGHVRYLQQARDIGDILVLGLNSDESVSRLKPGRPIVPEQERAEVLAALSAIDYVVIFNEETPYELIKQVRPDVLVKGGDWAREDIVGNDLVEDVRSLPFSEGLSTTSIIDKIKNS